MSKATVGVYLTEDEKRVLKAAAAKEKRSVSAFLLHLGLKRAEELKGE